MNTASCRSCGAAIVWLKTRAGKTMPVDSATIPPGTDPVFDAAKGHISHFATCPNADRHRKRK